MKRPSVIYVIPALEVAEGECLDWVSVDWEKPPGVGATCVILPVTDGAERRRIRWLYTVTSRVWSHDAEWPWDLELDAGAVPEPRYWYDITESLMLQGLVVPVGVYGESEPIAHPPTIEAIYDLLGF